MSDPFETLSAFLGVVDRIEAILGEGGEVDAAKKLPELKVAMLSRVTIAANTTYPDWRVDKNDAEDIRRMLMAKRRAEGEKERDDLIVKLSAELNILRASLPSMATSASIAIGAIIAGLKEH